MTKSCCLQNDEVISFHSFISFFIIDYYLIDHKYSKDITIRNTDVTNIGALSLTSGTEIKTKPEFFAEDGSEVHLKIDPTLE